MREIKFRAWDKEEEEMFSDVSIVDDTWDMLNEFLKHKDELVLMQFTGLKDKSGVEIYEGDVVKGSYYAGYNIGIKRIIGSVSWTSASFKINGVKQYEGTRVGLDGSFEVIGNIHEHKFLLGE